MSTTDTISERELAEILTRLTPQARNLASNYHLDFEDVLQEIALLVIEKNEKISDRSGNIKGYFARCVHNHFLANYSEKYSGRPLFIDSLDEPLSDESPVTRADLLAAPEQVTHQMTLREKALHRALHGLRIEEQRYFMRVYQFADYTLRRARNKRCQGHYSTSTSDKALNMSGFRTLRKNKHLARVMGVLA